MDAALATLVADVAAGVAVQGGAAAESDVEANVVGVEVLRAELAQQQQQIEQLQHTRDTQAAELAQAALANSVSSDIEQQLAHSLAVGEAAKIQAQNAKHLVAELVHGTSVENAAAEAARNLQELNETKLLLQELQLAASYNQTNESVPEISKCAEEEVLFMKQQMALMQQTSDIQSRGLELDMQRASAAEQSARAEGAQLKKQIEMMQQASMNQGSFADDLVRALEAEQSARTETDMVRKQMLQMQRALESDLVHSLEAEQAARVDAEVAKQQLVHVQQASYSTKSELESQLVQTAIAALEVEQAAKVQVQQSKQEVQQSKREIRQIRQASRNNSPTQQSQNSLVNVLEEEQRQQHGSLVKALQGEQTARAEQQHLKHQMQEVLLLTERNQGIMEGKLQQSVKAEQAASAELHQARQQVNELRQAVARDKNVLEGNLAAVTFDRSSKALDLEVSKDLMLQLQEERDAMAKQLSDAHSRLAETLTAAEVLAEQRDQMIEQRNSIAISKAAADQKVASVVGETNDLLVGMNETTSDQLAHMHYVFKDQAEQMLTDMETNKTQLSNQLANAKSELEIMAEGQSTIATRMVQAGHLQGQQVLHMRAAMAELIQNKEQLSHRVALQTVEVEQLREAIANLEAERASFASELDAIKQRTASQVDYSIPLLEHAFVKLVTAACRSVFFCCKWDSLLVFRRRCWI